jgi:hypothetical protein
MTDPCLPIEELLALHEPSARDPHWSHVRSCPRCRNLLAVYRAFVAEDGGESPGEREAVPRLQAFLERQVRGEVPAVETGIRPFLRRRLGLRVLIPAAGAAAILVAVVLFVRDELSSPFGTPTLREESGSPAAAGVVGLAPRVLDGGGIELRWKRNPAAETYRVRILDVGMREVRSLPAGPDTLVVVAPSQVAGLTPPVFWQVEALVQGDRIGDSVPAALPAIRPR